MQYKKIDLGDTLGEAFENYKGILGIGALVMLIYVVVATLATFALVGIALGSVGLSGLGNLDEFTNIMLSLEEGLPIAGELIISVGTALVGALISPMIYGLLKLAHDSDVKNSVNFESAFVLYSKPFFSNVFMSILVLNLGLALVNLGLTLALPLLGGIIYGVIAIVAYLYFYFSIPFILFKRMNWIDSYKASVEFFNQNPWAILGGVIVAFLFALVGIIGCGFGLLLTAPFVYSVQFMLFKNGVGMESDSELIQEIGKPSI